MNIRQENLTYKTCLSAFLFIKHLPSNSKSTQDPHLRIPIPLNPGILPMKDLHALLKILLTLWLAVYAILILPGMAQGLAFYILCH